MPGTFQQYAVSAIDFPYTIEPHMPLVQVSFVNYVTKIPDGIDGALAAPLLCAVGVWWYQCIFLTDHLDRA